MPFARELPVANAAVIFRELPDGAVLLATETEIYFGLNEVGTRIWQLLPPASASFDELCARLAREYPDAPLETIRVDVAELLDALLEQGLAVPSSALPDAAPLAAVAAR
jgi:hypothetical protein